MKKYWLMKSEPDEFSIEALEKVGREPWTGVRNYQARIHLNAMRQGDRVYFYESVTTKAVLGIAEVTRPAAPDPTAKEPGWVSVELKAVKALPRPVTLAEIKAEPALANLALLRQSRLSVMPLAKAEFARIESLARK